MQLRLKPRTNKNLINRNSAIKIILIFLVFSLGIFLLDKIDFPAPKKLIKQEISRLYEDRKNIYKLADHKINCDHLSKKNIAKKIINFYEKY